MCFYIGDENWVKTAAKYERLGKAFATGILRKKNAVREPTIATSRKKLNLNCSVAIIFAKDPVKESV